MAQDYFTELLNISSQADNDRLDRLEYETPLGETSFGDYALDLFRAPVGGLSDAIQGLVQLGALPLDYALDTNFSEKITDFFDKYTPDARTGVGELVQTLVQFGLPLGVASKVGSGIKILKGATGLAAGAAKIALRFPGTGLALTAGYLGAKGIAKRQKGLTFPQYRQFSKRGRKII